MEIPVEMFVDVRLVKVFFFVMAVLGLRSTEIGCFPPQVLHLALRDRSDKLHHIAQAEEGQPDH